MKRNVNGLLALTVAGLFVGACVGSGPTSVSAYGAPSRTLSALRGAEIDLTLQTIGPGDYDSPPTISSDAVAFIGMGDAKLVVPAGPTQIFKLRAYARGTAIVDFVNTYQNRTVEDTIIVE